MSKRRNIEIKPRNLAARDMKLYGPSEHVHSEKKKPTTIYYDEIDDWYYYIDEEDEFVYDEA